MLSPEHSMTFCRQEPGISSNDPMLGALGLVLRAWGSALQTSALCRHLHSALSSVFCQFCFQKWSFVAGRNLGLDGARVGESPRCVSVPGGVKYPGEKGEIHEWFHIPGTFQRVWHTGGFSRRINKEFRDRNILPLRPAVVLWMSTCDLWLQVLPLAALSQICFKEQQELEKLRDSSGF